MAFSNKMTLLNKHFFWEIVKLKEREKWTSNLKRGAITIT